MIPRDSFSYAHNEKEWTPLKSDVNTGALRVSDDYAETLYYYDGSGNLEYMCQNVVHGMPLSSETWIITKMTYGANGVTNRERLVGSVDNRAVLAWR